MNYMEVQKQNNKPAINYDAYPCIYIHNFKIVFLGQRKDHCDHCVTYKNTLEEKINKCQFSK